jgi:hypothetical protein
MRIVTASNERYWGKIQPYLDSLRANSQLPATLVCVGDRHDPFSTIPTVLLPRCKNLGAPLETESPQHGSFLQVLDGPADEVLIFTDGDIIMQRPFTEPELAWLDTLPDNTVYAGYNSGPDETLTVEAGRLFPKAPLEQIGRLFGLMDRPCYNIGVFVARRTTYRAIYDGYMKHWQLACEAFGHMARQQWLVCWTIHKLGINVQVTPYSFHANGHYGMPAGCHYKDGQLFAGEELVLMRHKL